MKTGRKTQSMFSRFISKVSITFGCWHWTGQKNNWGYGIIRHPGKTGKREGAHRVAWKFYNGEIPDGIQVCHHCDNPSCVRPSHLFLGTQKDNIQDAISKSRIFRPKLSESDIVHIKALDMPQRRIASLYGVSQQRICAIKNFDHAGSDQQ
jgi:HNH endonuclease